MKADLIETTGRADWLKRRMQGVGATDAAAILGKHPWRSPIEVYLDKLGLAEEREPTEAMEMGLELEPIVAGRYVKKTGRALMSLPPYTIAQSADVPWAFCSPDRITEGFERLVELKAPGFMQLKEFGEEGTDDIPEQYLIQCLWSMQVMGLGQSDLCALFGGQQTKIFHMEHEWDVGRIMIERVGIWWERHVVQRETPEIDGSDAWSKYIAKQFPANKLPLLESNVEVDEIAETLSGTRDLVAQYKAQQALLENQLKALIGDAEGIKSENWKATWRKAKDGIKTDYESVARRYAIELERAGVNREYLNDITKKFTVATTGSRRFLFKFNDEASE